HAGASQRLDLVAGAATAAGDDRPGMAHAPARGRGQPGDESDHRLLALLGGEQSGGFLLGAATDLADHDDAGGLPIAEEELEAMDEAGAVDGIAADADAGRLAESGGGGLRHRLVGQGAGARDDADAAAGVDMPGHDADLALVGRDHAGTV